MNEFEVPMLGSGEIIVILCVVMLLFGGKKLPEFARSLGKGIREFKRACSGLDGEVEEQNPPTTLDVTTDKTDTASPSHQSKS